ncbi:Flagellar hook-length control protein FliK [Sphingomonas sp. NFR04]|uniref:flagellar hook-length control protein FliK n=1 Tax=Sphingomonas sp. NFR04 TaxID=1566283 RepID=UPI0008EBCC7D|nr:flagellar hook-length control protein FliK [Sphingomonas sp. NFR04]SFK18613.1 Flagellar hook-length control protein FliK [Sphingomonas sp. NFR04]
MNVTNIGSPFAAPVSQEGAANAAAGSGFAGLLGGVGTGGVSGWAGQGLVFAGAGTTGLLGAQTGAPLLPVTPDANALPGDKPQVGMTQLLATAAPGAVTPPVATGGNPLADAIAKALADARGNAEDATATPGTAAPKPKPTAVEAKPDATTDALAELLDATAPKPTEDAAPGRPMVGVKVAKPGRGAGGDKNGLDPAGAPLPAPEAATPAVVQPIAVPVAQQQPSAQPAPAQQPAAQSKTSGVTGPRYAKADAMAGNEAAPAQTTNDKMADLADAVGAHPHGGGATDGGSAGDHGQQNFGQQLAAADTRHSGAVPFPTASGHVAPAASAAPAAPAAEPVLNARAGELGRSLGVEIARKVDAGEDTLRVRMNPAELGRVEVTLAFDDKGRVQATMRAESQHTLELLRQEAPDLGRALDQAGIRSDASSFRFESRDGGTSSGGNGQQASQQQSRGGNQQFHDEPDAQTAAYRPIRGDGQVDLIA